MYYQESGRNMRGAMKQAFMSASTKGMFTEKVQTH